ncbi:MAG TPA: TAXI family TRAP transporter solute-binding subunit [Hyphomicrobiaceae bacterium]|nr:TAXI family TRAP transporter solute-binding subunit [Hyphomicrobiaceae bacterium]
MLRDDAYAFCDDVRCLSDEFRGMGAIKMKAVCVGALLLSCVVPATEMAHAQSSEPIRLAQQQRATNTPREQLREQMNENVVNLMGGQLGAVYIVIAHDISVAVNDGNNMRVLPVVGGAGVQNIRDVVFLRGVDLGVTNILSLNKLKETGELGPNLDQQVAYIAPLFNETMQVVARPEINRVEDLRGKRVAVNSAGSATAEFAPAVFKSLNVEVQTLTLPQGDALEKMQAGEIHATVCTCPIPIPAYSNVKAASGFKLLSIPYTPALERATYYPAAIKASEYPNLIPADGKVETIATSAVLISFNWQRGSIRYNRLARFTDAFFSKFDNLLQPARHPLWKTVNLAATIPGWQRFSAAQEWLDKNSQRAASAKSAKEETAERLFRQFLEWQRTNKQ